jgi:hypothetical protein
MVKVTFGNPDDLRADAASRRPRLEPRTRRVATEAGDAATVVVIDAHSPAAADELLAAFRKNVRRARQATRKAVRLHGVAAE